MILKILFNTRMIWMICIKILINTILIKNKSYLSHLMISLLICLVMKNLIQVVTKLFIRVRKLNISLVFIPQSYFAVLKYIRLNSTHYFNMRISNKRELQKIAFNHSSNIDEFIFMYYKTKFFFRDRYYPFIR